MVIRSEEKKTEKFGRTEFLLIGLTRSRETIINKADDYFDTFYPQKVLIDTLHFDKELSILFSIKKKLYT